MNFSFIDINWIYLLTRAEKSEVFTEDLQSAERHVELMKQSCMIMSKKISSLLSGSMHYD